MPVNDYLVPLLTCTLSDRRNHLSGHRADMLLSIKYNRSHHHKSFGIFRGHCFALLHKYRYWYWVLVSLEANVIGYWNLDIGCLAWYRSNRSEFT